MTILLQLMITAAKVGLTAFGGGLATIAIYSYELVGVRGWMSPEEFTQMVAVCQSFPGPVAVNIATYVGYKMCGVPGSLAATVALISAPLCILIGVLWIFAHSSGKTRAWVDRVQRALRPSVGALLFISLVSLMRPLIHKTLAWPLIALSIALIYFVPFVRKNPQIVLLTGAIAALLMMHLPLMTF